MRFRPGNHIMLFLLLWLFNTASAQKLPVQSFMRVLVVADTLYLDSAGVVPSTLRVTDGETVLSAGKHFTLLPGLAHIRLTGSFRGHTLEIRWISMPKWITMSRANRQPYITYSTKAPEMPEFNSGTETTNPADPLNTDGVLLRGLSFGNAQDLTINSSLNLRMNGQVSPGLGVEAALTDQEYPFQPDGTTSALQDFDRIYVKMYTPRLYVMLGDYPFISPSVSRFTRYSKKNRGLQLHYRDTLKSKAILDLEGSAALARGRFARNEIQGLEGMQGPYRLSGARGEQFVIVVSGTEVVYLDGKRMERGLQSDYVMDYNLGEITFTPRHLINAFSRIVVEFQYSDRQYTRVVAASHAVLQKKKWTAFANVYTEQDAKTQPIQQNLNLYDSTRGLDAKQILELAGDNPALAVMSGTGKPGAFNTSRPNYIRIDSASLVFYRFAAAPDTGQQYYQVAFTYVGAGQGQYVIQPSLANGKVFRYTGPAAGDYEPLLFLQPPGSVTMAETGLELNYSRQNRIKVNIAGSRQDKNRFSGIGDNDNNGLAAGLNWSHVSLVHKRDSARTWQWKNSVECEYTSTRFTSIERYRDVEFGRIWSPELGNPAGGSNPAGAGYVLHNTEISGRHLTVRANWGARRLNNDWSRTGGVGFRLSNKGWFFAPSALWSSNEASNNRFNRYLAETGYEGKKSQVKLYAQTEKSIYDLLILKYGTASYGFTEWGTQSRIQAGRLSWNLLLNQRVTSAPELQMLKPANAVWNAVTDLSLPDRKGNVLKLGLSYRNMELLDTLFQHLYRTENHLASRAEYSFRKVLRRLDGNIFYQTLSGREAQKQYSYFEVPAGQGYFTWIDFNGNGLQETSEFQEARFRDQARFVRLLVPTGTYIRSQGVDYSGNLHWRPNRNAKGTFQSRTSWNYSGKSVAGATAKRYFPFLYANQSADILSANGLFRNQAEWESPSGKWLIQYTTLARSSKVFFTSGFDRRHQWRHTAFARTEFGRSWQLRWSGEWLRSRYASEIQPANDFKYSAWQTEPVITWQSGSRSRINLSHKVQQSFSASSVKLALLNETAIQITRSLGRGGQADVRFSTLQASYNGPLNTPLAFELLQGFKAGTNFRWNADVRMKATRAVQLVFSYEGRHLSESRIIHIGRAEARYLF
ncbi:MAG: hypothetical protein JNL57_02105 [Bacteroidetes bacterium]|nr:hypothetical protein [Bacteroidota bacterium]